MLDDQSKNQDFIIQFDYFENRNQIFDLFAEIADAHEYPALKQFQIYVNNIPTSLEFYAHLSYASDALKEINYMKELLFPLGKYRIDLSSTSLFEGLGDRRFISYVINDSSSAKLILHSFWYKNINDVLRNQMTEKHIQRLRKEGYDAFEKLTGGTTLFFSHSSKQKQELEQIMPYFTSVNELIWLDKFRIEPNQDEESIKKEIKVGLNQANTVLFFVTDDFLESKWCQLELELSIEYYHQKDEYTFLLVIINDIKDFFFSKYSIMDEIVPSENILILQDPQQLEEHIGVFINKYKEYI